MGVDLQLSYHVRETGEVRVYQKMTGWGNGLSEAILAGLEALMASKILEDPEKWQIRQDAEHLIGELRPRAETRKRG